MTLKFVRRYITALVMLFIHFTIVAEDSIVYKSGWIIPATFCKPFLADLSSTITTVGVGINKNNKEYDLSPKKVENYKPTVVVNLGASIPIYTKNIFKNRFGFAFSAPIHFQLWIDMFENTTAPVLNTDTILGYWS